MSAQTWTDDELQKHLKEWDISRPAGITLTTYPRKNPWVTETFALDCAGIIIALTRPQALIVSDWFRRRAEAFMSSKKEQANERDTHFVGFAKLLREELMNTSTIYIQDWEESRLAEFEQVIARRAYDLVLISIKEASANDLEYVSAQEKMQYIPDMTEWPEESK